MAFSEVLVWGREVVDNVRRVVGGGSSAYF